MAKDKHGKKVKRARAAQAQPPVLDAEHVLAPEPAPTPEPAPPPAPIPPVPSIDAGRMSFGLNRIANTLGGATLCYGEPVHVGERVVIPIARVRGAGGYGFGRGVNKADGEEGDGGGGGGALEATPAGFLDITPDGVRFEAIPDPVTTARAISTGASAAAMLVSAVLGIRRASRRRRTAGLLSREP